MHNLSGDVILCAMNKQFQINLWLLGAPKSGSFAPLLKFYTICLLALALHFKDCDERFKEIISVALHAVSSSTIMHENALMKSTDATEANYFAANRVLKSNPA